MNLSDDETLELNALCSALVDRSLDRPGRARLGTLLASSEEARRFYVCSMALSASLHDFASELQSEEPQASGKIVRVAAWRWVAGALAAAAAVLLAFRIGGSIATAPGDALVAAGDDESFVATLSAKDDCRWKGAGPQLGDELRQGRQLQLASGVVEITFNSGAQVEIEGPAALDLTSAWEAVLRHGSLRANVPPEAVGFRVSNPDVQVTDLGTEFSMLANERGGTEVFVLKGAVEASAQGRAQPIMLHERQAQRFERSRVTEVGDREQKLRRWGTRSKLMRFATPVNYAHWSFDETAGTTLHAEVIGISEAGTFDGEILAPGNTAERRIAGHRSRALALDGRTRANVRVPGWTKAGLTIAFWVQVPEDAALTEAGPITAIDGCAEISWNRDPRYGAIGALRTRTAHGQIIGATPLRDGRWHHVAVVFGSNGRARQYVDGRLEIFATQKFKRHREERSAFKSTASAAIAIGGGNGRRHGEGFRGAIDELFIASRALTPLEIRQLQRENRLVPPATIADASQAGS